MHAVTPSALNATHISMLSHSCTSTFILSPSPTTAHLLPIPHSRNLRIPHLLLQLKDPVHQRLARRRAPRHIYIDRYDPIAPSRDAIAVVIIPSSIRTATHAHNPSRIRHLVVHLAEGRGHFVGQGASDDHDVRLAGGGTEDYAEAVLVVARGGEVHHFDSTTGEAKGHGPEGALAGPVGDLVKGCSEL